MALLAGKAALYRVGYFSQNAADEKSIATERWILPAICGYPATRIMSDLNPSDSVEICDSFVPRFDGSGLITAVVVDAASGSVLMVAHMDAEALAKSRASGLAHFHSRSRGKLWLKGETSGNLLHVEEIRVDCDQDCLLIRVRPAGPACHTGAPSCFYRRLDGDRLLGLDD